MSNFTPLVSHSEVFEGDTVTMDLRCLKRSDMLKLMPYMEISQVGNDTVTKFTDQNEFAKVMMDFLPSNVSNFHGLTDSSGAPVTLETMVSELYFNKLTMNIIGKLMEISSLREDEAKKSEQ